ncbi:MAG: phosphodiester glycosidase family protein, partial [Cyanobacteria bacterium P01_H01_bin.130]
MASDKVTISGPGGSMASGINQTIRTLRGIAIAAVSIAVVRAGLNQVGSALEMQVMSWLQSFELDASESGASDGDASTVAPGASSPDLGHGVTLTSNPQPLFGGAAPAPRASVPSQLFADPSSPPLNLLGDRPANAAVPQGAPISFTRRQIGAVRFFHARLDLRDPTTFITVGLANNAKVANSRAHYGGREKFPGMVKRSHGALTVNGTFFSGDQRARVMGNLIAEGQVLKYSRWENYGTTLGLTADGNGVKQAEMVTARTEGRPKWENHWFSLTAGPRLVRQGKLWLAPKSEGFRDRRVFAGKAKRSAIGISKDGRYLHLVTFITPITLTQEAHIMIALGSRDAMN